MSFKVFSKINLWWIETDIFTQQFKNSNSGTSIASLKVIIAIALEADHQSRLAKISLSEIQDITGLSRPMVTRAIQILLENKLINAIERRRGKSSTYQLNDVPPLHFKIAASKGWARLPYKPLIANLSQIPNRGLSALAALKNYLIMLKYRQNDLTTVGIKHKTFVEKGALQPKQVKKGNDILFNHELISITRVTNLNTNAVEHVKNLYEIKGLGLKSKSDIALTQQKISEFNLI